MSSPKRIGFLTTRPLEVLTSAPGGLVRVWWELVKSGFGCVTIGTLQWVTVGVDFFTSAVEDLGLRSCSGSTSGSSSANFSTSLGLVARYRCLLFRRTMLRGVLTTGSRHRTFGNDYTWCCPFLLLIYFHVDSISRLKFRQRSHPMSLVKGLTTSCLALHISFSNCFIIHRDLLQVRLQRRKESPDFSSHYHLTRAHTSGCVRCSSIAHQNSKWIILLKDFLGNVDATFSFTVCLGVIQAWCDMFEVIFLPEENCGPLSLTSSSGIPHRDKNVLQFADHVINCGTGHIGNFGESWVIINND